MRTAVVALACTALGAGIIVAGLDRCVHRRLCRALNPQAGPT